MTTNNKHPLLSTFMLLGQNPILPTAQVLLYYNNLKP